VKVVVRWLVLLVIVSPAWADDMSAEFEQHTFAWHDGAKMPYRLLKPEKIEDGKKYPLVMVLHGWGERGTDNKKQLNDYGPAFLKPNVRKRFPCFVLLPQANGSWINEPVFDKPIRLTPKPTISLTLAHEILNSVVKKYPVDTDRLYLTGYSNGACAVWEMLEREPHRWAAAAPMAGAGDPSRVGAAKNVAIWAFHGEKDPTIPIIRMRELVAALKAAHGHPMFTIIPKGKHYSSKDGLHDPNLIRWMFAQRRGQPEVPFEKVAKPNDKRPTSLGKT
jgi:predicted peptidase